MQALYSHLRTVTQNLTGFTGMARMFDLSKPNVEPQPFEELEHDSEILAVRHKFFPPAVEADSEEGQRLLGSYAQSLEPNSFTTAGTTQMDFISADELKALAPAPFVPNDQIDDGQANSSGAGCDRSRVFYMVGLLRDQLYAHKSRGEDYTIDLSAAQLAAHATPGDAYVHAQFPALVAGIRSMIAEAPNRAARCEELFTAVENMGYYIWFGPNKASVSLRVEGLSFTVR